MKRRAVLQFVAALVAHWPVFRARAAAQAGADLSDANLATLEAIAEVGLPGALTAPERTQVAAAFGAWHRNYREGADRGHGYGSGRLSAPTGPPPARQYPAHFAALDRAAASSGAASFAAAPLAVRRTIVLAALDEPRVANLPSAPNGANLVADFLGFYFNSPEAWDLAYQASIRRDSCRSLDGSDQAPPRFGSGSGAE